ncbi:A24 family peptidase [Paenibacillus cisolokensis]|uniref:A24 family peptidase n=1 Tax=Paenibacillus cisolokensis TaxID=1658519 RepID=UPI003D2A1B18
MELAFGACGIFLLMSFITDIRTMKIPNVITVSAMTLGLLYHGVIGEWEGLFFSLKGLGTGFFILLIMYFTGAVGAGDVKLFGGIGAWTGALFTLQCILYSVLFAGVIGLCLLLWRREVFSRLRRVVAGIAGVVMLRSLQPWRGQEGEHLRFPFMTAVLPGAIGAYLFLYV